MIVYSFSNTYLIFRVSSLANQHIYDDFPSFKYTNETLHSTNVAEKFALLFENEWKLAYEDLADRGYHDEECVYKLMRVIRVCLMSVSMNILLLDSCNCTVFLESFNNLLI